jgi:thiamine biosynthesis lipoprotein
MEYYEFRAMNTTVQLAAEGDPARMQQGFKEVQDFVDECEQRFSRFIPESELSSLNASSGDWCAVSADLYEIVQEALELNVLTDGLFDPSILPALIDAGYDRSMDEIRQVGPLSERPAKAWRRPDLQAIQLDPDQQAILIPKGMMLDLGGIAKGWIAARAAQRLNWYAPACAVSAGGDFAICGFPEEQPNWQISLEDPRDPQQILAILRTGPGALATSSVTKRKWIQGNQTRHHIIDPRIGQPAEPSWLSVTVWTQKATYAEAFAKALLIAAPLEGPALAARVPGLRFIAVDTDGSLWGPSESKEMIYHVADAIIE